MNALLPALESAAGRVERMLATLIPDDDTLSHARVSRAMRYACLGGGKRLRPFLLMESARLFDMSAAGVVRGAAALEMLHCYSLAHDDLPSMDNAAQRRGRPAVHIAFDEATAILAGDGLLTLAFEVLADEATHPDAGVRAALVATLAQAAGMRGMIGGQVIDLEGEQRSLNLAGITTMQRLKTGALFGWACDAGAVLGGAEAADRAALRSYAAAFGLAFQIADDILDAEGDPAETGKHVGHDAAAGKSTFVSLLGSAGARVRADELVAEAVGALARFGKRAELLRDAARFITTRRH